MFQALSLMDNSAKLATDCSSKLVQAHLSGLSYVTLDHKTSLKSLGYICSNSQK